MNKKAFTLVELIVVITILSVLATVAFVSFQGYTASSRDSVRVSDLRIIEKALELELTKNNKIPYPTDYINLTASGEIIGYQGYAGTQSLGKIGIADVVLDPLDKIEYTYSTNKNRTEYQLLGFLESQESSTIYDDNIDRSAILKGDKLGIIVETATSQPIQNGGIDIDVVTTTDTYGVFLSNKETKYTGTGGLLSGVLTDRVYPKGNCLSILQNGNSEGNGEYSIISKNGEYSVYCDMETDGGGWTYATMFDATGSGNLFETTNTDKITSLVNNVSTKGKLSDMWTDTNNRDIMVLCKTNYEVLKGYEIPLIIYDYEYSDINMITDQAKASLPFSTNSKVIKWNGYSYMSYANYGPSGKPNSIYIGADGYSQRLIMIYNTSLGAGGRWNVTNSPAGSELGEQYYGMNSNNYCMTAIR